MARKTSVIPTRIWSFGVQRPPEETATAISDQLRLANRYYNARIELCRERRRALREARLRLVPRLAELEDQYDAVQIALEAARQELRDLRRRDRRRTEAPTQHREQITALIAEARSVGRLLTAERRAVSAATKAARQSLQQRESLDGADRSAVDATLDATPRALLDLVDEEAAIWERFYEGGRVSRANCGVYWGTYLLIEQAVETADKKSERGDPRFRRFDGSGRIGIQIQGGVTTEDLFAGRSNLLQIDPLPPDQWDTRSGRRHARTTARIRIGSQGRARAPVWAELSILLHRPLPPGVIKTAWVLVRRVGPSVRYDLQLAIEAPSFARRSRGTGTVALDVGWRSLPNGNLRVAYWVDDSGRHGSLELPESLRMSYGLPETLRSHRDTHFEAARAHLRAWLDRQSSLPDWLSEATSHIAHWRDPRRLAVLARRLAAENAPDASRLFAAWREERLAERPRHDLFGPASLISQWLSAHGVRDEATRVATYLYFWAAKNRHLYEWEANQRDKVLGHRKDIYCQWATWLVATYGTIVLEDFDLRSVAKRAKPEEEDDPYQAVRHNRTIAAISELRGAIADRAVTGALVTRPASRTTITCHACGHCEDFDREAELVHTCPGCRSTWDQDRNAAINLLRLGLDPEATSLPE